MYVDLAGLRRCEQRWDDMRPVEGGRLCGACDRRIVDFRPLTDVDVALTHLGDAGPVCGIYSDAQLARLGLVAAAPARPRRALPVLALGASLLGTGAAAQQAPPPTEAAVGAESAPGASLRAQAAPAAGSGTRTDTVTVTGVVRDGATGEILAGAMVWVEGTTHRTVTDSLGAYLLRVPRSAPAHRPQLAFTRIGYEHRRVPLSRNDRSPLVDVALQPAQIEVSAFYVTGYPERRSVWQRVRDAVGRVF